MPLILKKLLDSSLGIRLPVLPAASAASYYPAAGEEPTNAAAPVAWLPLALPPNGADILLPREAVDCYLDRVNRVDYELFDVLTLYRFPACFPPWPDVWNFTMPAFTATQWSSQCPITD